MEKVLTLQVPLRGRGLGKLGGNTLTGRLAAPYSGRARRNQFTSVVTHEERRCNFAAEWRFLYSPRPALCR